MKTIIPLSRLRSLVTPIRNLVCGFALLGGAVMLSAADTAVLPKADSTAARTGSAAVVPDSSADTIAATSDTAGKAVRSAAAKSDSGKTQDTAYSFWLHPFWGFGAGWTLGSFPLFSAWQSPLPGGTGIYKTTAVIDSHTVIAAAETTIVRDSSSISFNAIETPAPYTIYFPVTFSRYFLTDSARFLSLDLSLFLIYKALKIEERVRHDTTTLSRQTINQSLGFYTGMIGLRYSGAIPTRYFSIQGVNRASLTAGLSIIPFAWLNSSYSRKTDGDVMSDSALKIIAQGSELFLRKWSYSGAGLSWLLGVSGLTKYSPVKGVEIGLYYSGNWIYFPNLSEQILNPVSPVGAMGYSFICHRLAIDFTLLRGTKKRDQ
jgi:hypothetical protein